MIKSKHYIRTTADAAAAPVGTIVLDENNWGAGGNRTAVQKQADGWYGATGWEMSDSDNNIRGEVLVWGAVKPGRKITDQNDASEVEADETPEVTAFRDRAEKLLREASAGYAWDDGLAEGYVDGINAAADIINMAK